MKIEAGKYYKTRDGRKVGPIYQVGYGFSAEGFTPDYEGEWCWYDDGSWLLSGESKEDLISEWQGPAESPIRTVTRREIVAGVYGIVRVSYLDGVTSISLNPFEKAEELREAAHILNQIAEALEENGK